MKSKFQGNKVLVGFMTIFAFCAMAEQENYELNGFSYEGPYDEAIINGAIHIMAQQCSDGGWASPHNACQSSASIYSITSPINDAVMITYENTELSVFKHSAVAAGDFNLGSTYTSNGSTAVATQTPLNLWRLTALTGDSVYRDWVKNGFYEALLAGTYGSSGNFDTADYIADARANIYKNIFTKEFSSQVLAAERYCYPGIADQFKQAILDELALLDDTAIYDIAGLAGGVLGLARVNQLVFPEIVAANQLGVNGESTLEGLAEYLVSLQQSNGSFHYTSQPGGFEHTQTTAIAILALISAQERLPHKNYLPAIGAAKDWLAGFQDEDGGFRSYPGGPYGTVTEAEAVYALAAEGVYDRIFQGQMECYVN
ncbi:prenyltransferase/squalene oxidase repeat-containing protein [Marinicella gelatinilytica]|uniref:prenyltransferase/squalene oxidase repeat-containing protein n=1 Tax=Marinicella gelatinilytica TaxID=2996017 RepID=UPI0022608473|nr:prenyltransferase/squalene oxidase repeat-containing protein [Marinicella gelatinilytica]MCX7545571.1 hypothetical protein [Marinicella gelatinilytica]